MSVDLGGVVPLSITIKDINGALADAGAVSLVVTLPDGTSSGTLTSTHGTVGNYYYDYTAPQAGRYVVVWTATGSNAGVFTDIFHVRDPADLPVVSLSQVRGYLNIPATDTTTDSDLQFFSDIATDVCEGYRPLRRMTVTQTMDGGGTALRLFQTPVVSVSTVVENGVTLTGSQYVVDKSSGLIYKGTTSAQNAWATGVGNVSVTYVAGYSNIPAAGQAAVLEQIRHLWSTQRGNRPGSFNRGASGDDYIPGAGHIMTYRVQELLDSLGSTPGFG